VHVTDPPQPPTREWCRLEPLGPQHNERDHVAWMSSIEHIHATLGFTADDWDGDAWPYAMTLADNLVDLEQHLAEFERREAFAYSVIDPATDDVIGCIYIDPDDTGASDAKVRCWVRASHARLDRSLAALIAMWIVDAWPIASARFPGRDLRVRSMR
jgi:hypothetical protein